MASAAGNNDGDVNQTAVFIATSLDTRLVTTVSDSDTVYDFKKKIMAEHLQCYPAIGNIIVNSLKVKRRGIFYNLSDSILIKSAFGTTKGNWFMSADASSLTQDIDILKFNKHKVGDELALPLVTNNDSFVNKTVPFENQIVSKNPEEDMLSNSKKRARDVNNESLLNESLECGLVKKKRKTQRGKSIVKPLEENIVSVNNENDFEYKSKDEDLIGEKRCDLDQVVAVVPSSVEDEPVQITVCEREKENEPVQKGVMENEMPYFLIRTSDCERNAAGLIIAGSQKRGSKRSTKHKTADFDSSHKRVNKSAAKNKKETLVMHADDKLAGDVSSMVFAPILDEKIAVKSEGLETALINIDNTLEKQNEKTDVVKKSVRKKRTKNHALRNEDELITKHVKVEISDNVEGPQDCLVVLGSKKSQSVDFFHHLEDNEVEVKKNDKFSLTGPRDRYSKDRSTEVDLESKKSQSVDFFHYLEDISKDVTVSDVFEEENEKLSLTGPQDRLSKLQSTEDDLEAKKSQSVDHLEDTFKNVIVSEVFKVNNEVDITNDDFAPGDQPNKTGSIDNQKDAKKPKKKNSKSEGLVKAKKNNKSSLMGPPDLLSKDQSTEVDLESKKSQRVDHVDHHHHLEDASKNVIVSEVFKVNNEVDIANDDFAPGDQPNKTGSIDNQKDAKKPKKKISKNEGLVKAKKNNKSSLTGPPDLLSKDRSTEVELESNKKSQSVDHVDHHHHLEDASKNVIVSEVSKVNNEVDVTNDDFAPGDQPNKIGSIDNKKDAKKPKKKTNEGLVKAKKNDKLSLVGPQDQLSKDQSTEVDLESKKSQSVDHCHSNEAGSQEINFMDYFSSGHQPNKTASIENRKDTKKPKKIISKIKNKKVDADSSSSSQSFRISFHHQKSNKQQAVVGPAGNNLLKTPAKIFGDYESDESSADDNASLNSDSGTRTPSRNPSSPSSSSSEDRSYAMKRKEDGGKNSIMSQNKLKKNMSMSDLFRSSSRFKKAKLTASQTEDNESQPVDFVPDSQPLA